MLFPILDTPTIHAQDPGKSTRTIMVDCRFAACAFSSGYAYRVLTHMPNESLVLIVLFVGARMLWSGARK